MKKKKRSVKPHGHYCKVCGEHKANEKFSGKGHAAHICKACMSQTPAERSAAMAVRKIEGMAFRYLSEAEIKWLRGKINDARPEIRDAAREAHGMKFPHYERNMMKKGLTARSLEFFIHGEVWDEYGDEFPVHMRFTLDNSGDLRRIDYDAPEAEREEHIQIGQQPALKFLKAVVQQLNAPFWPEDLSDGERMDDPCLDFLPEFRDDDLDFGEDDPYLVESTDEPADEQETQEARGEPLWSLSLALNKGGKRDMTFYNQMHDEPQELFWLLMEWFEPEDDYVQQES